MSLSSWHAARQTHGGLQLSQKNSDLSAGTSSKPTIHSFHSPVGMRQTLNGLCSLLSSWQMA